MNRKAEKTRFAEIDICRGWGILLVVLGHALKQTGETNLLFSAPLSVIYSFHMPLFFVLSGFVAIKVLDFSSWKEQQEYIKDRALRLLVPYTAVGIVYLPVKIVLSRYALKPYRLSEAWRLILGDNPDVALWFLYILFLCSVLAAMVLTRKNLGVILAVTFGVSLLAYGWNWSLRLPKYVFFFVLGIYTRLHDEEILAFWKKRRIVGMVLIFAMANLVLYRLECPIMGMITAVSGIICSMLAAVWVSKKESCLTEKLQLLGRYSMDIYILSEPVQTAFKIIFWSVLHVNYVICTVLLFGLGLLLPIPLTEGIVRRFKVLRRLILGMK